jgi:hypothetical protein
MTSSPLPERDDYPDGWMTLDELHALEASADDDSLPGHILELGVWKGRSTVALARLGNIVICVDTFNGTPGEPCSGTDTYADFMGEIQKRGLSQRIIIFRASTANALSALRGTPIRLTLVDADHSAESCLADLRGSWDLLVPGGILYADDVDQKGPRDAVAQFSREKNVTFEQVTGKLARVVKR